MIGDELIRMIQDAKYVPAPVGEHSNLYTDLGFDSLDFVRFLVSVEDAYSILFELTEMMACLKVGQLVSIVEMKIRERDGHASKPAD